MWYVQCSILKSTITHVATMAMITFWTCGFWIAAFYVYFCKSKSAQYFSKYKGRPCLSVLWAVRILLSLRDKMDNIKHQAKTVKCFAVIDRFYVRVWVFLKCNCKKHLVGKCWKTSFQASNVPSSMKLKLAVGKGFLWSIANFHWIEWPWKESPSFECLNASLPITLHYINYLCNM